MARLSAGTSKLSPRTKRNSVHFSALPKNSSRPVERLSHPTTSSPTSSRRSTKLLPIKPAAPVTNAFSMRFELSTRAWPDESRIRLRFQRKQTIPVCSFTTVTPGLLFLFFAEVVSNDPARRANNVVLNCFRPQGHAETQIAKHERERQREERSVLDPKAPLEF